MNIEENLGILSAFILYLGGMIAIGIYLSLIHISEPTRRS